MASGFHLRNLAATLGIGGRRPMQPISDPWAGSYVTNPARQQAAIMGGTPVTQGSAGLTTSQPGVPSPAEQLHTAVVSGDINLDASPALAAANASAQSLTADPRAPLRQAPPTVNGVPIDTGAYLAADFGLGNLVTDQSRALASRIPGTGAYGNTARQALMGSGKMLGLGIKAAPYALAALPAVTGFAEGSESGPGGAAIEGGAATAGTVIGGMLGAKLGPIGIAAGMGIGGAIGRGIGGAGRGAAVAAVEAAQGGDTGFMGSIGRSLDPVIDTPIERRDRQIIAQMNSPANQVLQQQAQLRRDQERAAIAEQVLMQSLSRSYV